METVKSRSESPFPKSKLRSQSLDLPENRDVNEQMKTKTKTKIQQSKQKSHSNKKENVNSAKNGNDYYKEEVLKSHKIENDDEGNSNDHNNDNNDDDKENDHNIEVDVENENSDHKLEAIKEEKENEVNGKEEKLEMIDNQSIDTKDTESLSNDNSLATDVDVVEDVIKENGESITHETENSAKNDNSLEDNVIPTASEMVNGNDEMKINGETNSISTPTQTEGDSEDFKTEGVDQNGVNSSDDGSHYEDAHTTQKEQIQASPDTASKEEHFFSNKISNFLGKWNSSSDEQKQDLEMPAKVSNIHRSDETLLNHPYLSKVSGRRGIKDKINSTTTSVTSNNDEIKTPKNLTTPLDDSFRVRTNPSRLNSSELQQNHTLRKFKGKRCLNANDDTEDEEDNDYLTTTKRIKLDEKPQDSGLLGSILWSPFRKTSVDTENPLKLKNTESKLSRFLSPFWFWKKTTETQKGK